MSPRRHQGSVTGRVDVTHLLFRDRRIAVRTYLPADYEWSGRDYPVVYMFDAHNLFDRRTSTFNQEWQIDETMEEFHREGLPTAVVVGIDAPEDRFERYAMYSLGEWNCPRRPGDRRPRRIEGFGSETAHFLMHEVRGYAETTYRVARERDGIAVAGSSMGGYMALLTGATAPEVVSRVLAFSPAVLDEPMTGEILRAVLASSQSDPPQMHYLDMGDSEDLPYVESPRVLVDSLGPLREALESAGHRSVVTRVVPGGTHSEMSWSQRFGEVFRWAFAGGDLS